MRLRAKCSAVVLAAALNMAGCAAGRGAPTGHSELAGVALSDLSTPKAVPHLAPLAAMTPPPLPLAAAGLLTAPWSLPLVDVYLSPPPPKAMRVPASVIHQEFCLAPAPGCPTTQGQSPEIVLALGTDVADPNQPVDPNSKILPTFRHLLVWAVVIQTSCPLLGGPAQSSRPLDMPCTEVTLYQASSGRYLMGASAG
ncbi:MAG: hypothetical protein M3256_22005 [Actinomycetota bacterium]|nr:hypothetical protein [Actinomycetota bacterium]